MGILGSVFGSPKRSSNSSGSGNTSTTTTNVVTDRRVVADGGSVVGGDGSSIFIQSTDYGAIDQAKALGLAALDGAFLSTASTADKYMSTATAVVDRSLDAAELAFDQANQVVSDAQSDGASLLSGVLGFSREQAGKAANAQTSATELVRQAFTTSNDAASGNRALAFGALAVVGIVAALAYMRKGA